MFPASLRLLAIAAAVAATATGACRGSARGPANGQQTDTLRARTAAQVAAWDRLTAGRVVARAESRFSVIENDTCPGTRMVTSRFERTSGLLVLLVEDNSVVQCTEGIRSKPIVVVWRDEKYSAPPDTIRVSGHALSIIGGVGAGVEHSVPLVDGFEEGGGIGASFHVYYSLLSGKQLFMSEPPILTFVANGTRRYIAVRGGDSDTLAVVEYGTGAAPPQVLGMTDPAQRGGLFEVDTVSLDGPRRDGELVIGGATAKDTVPVSGITLRFRVGEMSSGADDPRFRYVVRIVNDRATLETSHRDSTDAR